MKTRQRKSRKLAADKEGESPKLIEYKFLVMYIMCNLSLRSTVFKIITGDYRKQALLTISLTSMIVADEGSDEICRFFKSRCPADIAAVGNL